MFETAADCCPDISRRKGEPMIQNSFRLRLQGRTLVALALLAVSAPVMAKADQPSETPPAVANLIIFRAYAQPTVWPVTVKIDGQKIASLGQKRFTALHLTPGTHKVRLVWPFISGQTNAEGEVSVADGQTSYLEIKGISQFAGLGYQTMYFNMGSSIGTRDAALAAETVRACCTFKAARVDHTKVH